MKQLLSLKNTVVSVAAVILVWQLLFMASDYSEALFPSPLMAFKALLETAKNGTLIENVKTSMYRFAIGYPSSVLIAVVLGLGRLDLGR